MAEQTQLQEDAVTEEKDTCCNNSSCCAPQEPIKREMPKIGRNDPCFCGSGRKHKKCCG